MLLVPRKNHAVSLFDEMFNDPFFRDPFFSTPFRSFSGNSLMKTDISEKNGEYRFEIDLPGFNKEDISAELNDGYLTVTAKKGASEDEKDADDNYVRRERYYGECSRSYYVGKNVTEEDIKASFHNGLLKITVPKEVQKIEEKKTITIS